jgi:PAS domain S-box-containing protein
MLRKLIGNRTDFYPYYEKEDSYRRVALVNGFGALILAPILAFSLFQSGAPGVYTSLAISYSIGYVVYALLCYVIKELNSILIYFLIGHLFVISFISIRVLANEAFKYEEVVYTLAFYILSVVIIQRLYATILYHVSIVVALVYMNASLEYSEIRLNYIIPFFALFGVAHVLMIYARNNVLRNINDHADYLKNIMNNPGSGYILFELEGTDLTVIDFNQEAISYFDLINNDKEGLTKALLNQFSDADIRELSFLKIGNRYVKRFNLDRFNKRLELELRIGIILIRNNQFLLANIHDVTEQSKKRQELEQSERKYRNLYYRNRAGVFTIDQNAVIIDGNDSFFRMFEQTLDKGDKLFTGKTTDDWSWILETLDESGTLQNYQTHFKLLNNSDKTFIFSWYLDKQTGLIEGSVIDLTSIQKASQALKQSEEKFRLIFEESNDSILLLSGDKIIDLNRSSETLFGMSRSDLQSKTLFDLSFNNDKSSEKKYRDYKSQLSNKRNVKFNWDLKNFTTNEKVEAEVAFVELIIDGKLYYQCVIHDLSEQNKLEKEKLRAEFAEETNIKLEQEIKERIKAEKRAQEEFLRSKAILDSSSNTFLLTLSLDKTISSFNSHCIEYFSTVFDKKIEKGTSFREVFNDILSRSQIRLFNILFNQVEKGTSHQIEVRLVDQKGEDHWIDIFINPILDIENKVSEISIVAHDISEKKKSNIEIEESLKEKEVLLKEIHHRVKNNLQVISSILNLQSSFVQDTTTLNILQESRNRIRSMAIIHENLYKTEDLSSINFGEYLHNLAVNLISSYRISEEILLNSEVQDVDLVLDQAIPCGLLVNEIISNSLKYAWGENEKGTITLKLSQSNGRVELEIGDDGVGLPDDFENLQDETLGLQLVLTLAEQLDAELQVSREKGTNYLVKFDNIKPVSNVKN